MKHDVFWRVKLNAALHKTENTHTHTQIYIYMYICFIYTYI